MQEKPQNILGFEDSIKAQCPMSVEDFMAQCVTHYYANHTPFGLDGDFITAPEISQIFGEIIGAWALNLWRTKWLDQPINLVELGPGRGTLMRDVLSVFKQMNADINQMRIVLVENSPALRETQKETLQGHDIHWSDVPDNGNPNIIIANEFFDALPMRQFCDGQERMVICRDDNLAFDCNGVIKEDAPARVTYAQKLFQSLKHNDGAALIIDYGYNAPTNADTLQAVYKHKTCSVFDHLGAADITSHICFYDLIKCARDLGLTPYALMEQGVWLNALGGYYRAEKLGQQDAYLRLTSSDQMGQLFKVLEVHT